MVVATTMLLALCTPANGAPYKSIWGPLEVGGVTQFPTYERLGVGIYQRSLNWSAVAPVRPHDPADPTDPAYRWPPEIDQAIGAGRGRGIQVSVLLSGAPGWANGGRSAEWAPNDPDDFAQFAAAASQRYPGVRHWMIWGEPSKPERFQPLARATGRRLTRRQRRGPRRYARILDASYAALKEVNSRNLIIGGNTWTAGGVVPLNFIRAMRLPGGRRPRMDLYGHNPFTARYPTFARGRSATAPPTSRTSTRWRAGSTVTGIETRTGGGCACSCRSSRSRPTTPALSSISGCRREPRRSGWAPRSGSRDAGTGSTRSATSASTTIRRGPTGSG